MSLLRFMLALTLLFPSPVHAQTKGDPMSVAAVADHAATIRRFYEECLNQHQSEILPEIFTPDVIVHAPNGDGSSLAAIQQTVERVHAMFPDHHFVVDDVVVNGDKAAARWTMTATNTAPLGGIPPTGKPITQRAVVFYRFQGDKIAEFWLQLDQIGVLRQIGVQIPGAPSASAPPAR
ncbi:ester cyclase [Edaphobacter albus]|uniref:ester cyclase n=1 Tax=Edaphobacter sp. 4G125 TaxID=2763071 RepID=UPI001648A0DA|nr:ester cyclase [Edaphobacter sp. 4G125]QNI36686.1 ester cyclase [Edaphobacter sp. 4G125]